MIRTFEYDDYPRSRARCRRTLDSLKRWCPEFKANVFAIPAIMTESDWEWFDSRRDWIQVCPHGFSHISGETWSPGYLPHLKLLDEVAEDDRWTKLFKAGWYNYDTSFLNELHARGFAIAGKSLNGFPYPIPGEWRMWNVMDHKVATGGEPEDQVVAHPYSLRRHANLPTRSLWRISPRNVNRWKDAWKTSPAEFAFVNDLTRPARLCISLGSGDRILPGWVGLDAMSKKWDSGPTQWAAGEPIPFGPNLADIIFASHMLVHVDESDWERMFLDVWRVLRPGAIWRITDDANDTGFEWRKLGARTVTGVIRSTVSAVKVRKVAERVGFQVYDSRPGYTMSPIIGVLQDDNRHRHFSRGHKFYLECVKAIEIDDLSRTHLSDERDAEREPGQYVMPRSRHFNVPLVTKSDRRKRNSRHPALRVLRAMEPRCHIFQIGYPRTGTQSLTYAMQQLGYSAWHEARHAARESLWRSMCDGAIVKSPMVSRYEFIGSLAPFFRELNGEYPDAKFILLSRDIESWLASVSRIIASRRKFLRRHRNQEEFTWHAARRLLLYGQLDFNAETFARRHTEYVKSVLSYFRDNGIEDRLLVWDLTKNPAWEPLCGFLGITEPDGKFPRINGQSKRHKNVKRRITASFK